jgi:predicted  nucleic acid-binding Zn-ribbon protein
MEVNHEYLYNDVQDEAQEFDKRLREMNQLRLKVEEQIEQSKPEAASLEASVEERLQGMPADAQREHANLRSEVRTYVHSPVMCLASPGLC